MKLLSYSLLFGALLLSNLLTGCSNEPIIVEVEVPEAQRRLMAIRAAYSIFQDQRGRPPQNERELLSCLPEDAPEDVLLSPRNQQPLVICYGTDLYGSLDWAKSTPVLAYEQVQEGPRWVLSVPGGASELSADEFAEASFPPGHKLADATE